MIVCKFGGSSLAKIEGINRIKEIVENNSKRKIIVVSAIGKRFNEDEKITDMLIKLTKTQDQTKKRNLVIKIKKRFFEIAYKLNLKKPEKIFNFDEFEEKIYYNKNLEFIISRGEYYTAKMLSIYFNLS